LRAEERHDALVALLALELLDRHGQLAAAKQAVFERVPI
jgi:hypothetical protein